MMKRRNLQKDIIAMLNSTFTTFFLAAASLGLLTTSRPAFGLDFSSGVPEANPRAGIQPNIVAPGFSLELLATGNNALENPSGLITHFGYLFDGPLQPVEA